MTLKEDDWNDLLTDIKNKKCTPFIGAGASAQWLPSGGSLATEWAEEHNYPLDDVHALASVAQFLAIQNDDDLFPKTYISRYFEKIVPPNFSLEQYRETPYSILADLNLPLYITTNYDDFMEAALESRGRKPVREFCRWNNYAKEAQIPSAFDRPSKYTPIEYNPLVYHLHGVIDTPQSMVLSEKDYIDFIVNLSSNKGVDILPAVIRKALVSNSLLFVGYSLSDINFRIIFRGIMNSVGKGLMLKNVAVLLPPHVPSNRVDNNPNKRLEYLDKYTKDMFKVHVYWGDAYEFSKVLRNRWDKFRS